MPQVTESTSQRKPLFNWAVLLAVVVVAAVGGWYGYQVYSTNLANRQQKDYQTMTDKAEQQIVAEHPAQAGATITAYLAKKPPKKYLPLTDSLMGAVFTSQNQPAEALVWYRREEQDQGSLGLLNAMDIARTANQSGDTATALKYYQAALPLWQKQTSPDAYQQAMVVENNIKLLQAQP